VTRRREHGARNRLEASSVAAGLAIATGYLVVQLPQFAGPAGVAVSILGLVAVAVLPVVVLRRRYGSATPGSAYALLTLATFGFGALAWLGHPPGASVSLDQDIIATALVAVSLGLACFWAGYLLAAPATREPILRPRVLTPLPLVWALFALGIASQIVLFQAGSFGYLRDFVTSEATSEWTQWFSTLAYVTHLAIFITAIHAFGNNSRKHLAAFWTIVLVNIAVGFISGFKGQVVWPLIWALFIYYYYRRRVPPMAVVAAVVGALLLIPANLAYRALARPTASTASPIDSIGDTWQAATDAVASTLEASTSQRVTTFAMWATARFRNIDSVALIVQKTPEQHPYLRGELYRQALPVTIVPRFLWPSKPSLQAGYEFGQKYLGLPPEIRTSIPITQPGDLYMNFGLAGVLLGMAAWGAAAGLLYRWFVRQASVAAILVYVTAISIIVTIEADFVSLVATGFRLLLMTLAVGWVLSRFATAPRSARFPPQQGHQSLPADSAAPLRQLAARSPFRTFNRHIGAVPGPPSARTQQPKTENEGGGPVYGC